MVASGLRIVNAYPAFARKGGTFCCYPFEGKPIPASLTFGGWLAGARHWHFAVMWILVVNAIVYLAFLCLNGEWRELAPKRGDVRDAWEMIEFYTFARHDHPHQGKHNSLQKAAYFAMPIVAAVIVPTESYVPCREKTAFGAVIHGADRMIKKIMLSVDWPP
jgi:thiosulfate reductase cytochrome b subunit